MNKIVAVIAKRYQRLAEAIKSGQGIAVNYPTDRYTYPVAPEGLGIDTFQAAELGTIDDKAKSIRFTISLSTEDRDRDLVIPAGVDLKNYARNPVVFFGHQEWEIPIGVSRAPDGRLAVYKATDNIKADWFVDEPDPDAMFIYGKVKRGILSASSIAFVPMEATRRDHYEKAQPHEGRNQQPSGWLFSRVDMTEWSIVGVPANAGAIRDAYDQERSFITPKMQKGLLFYAAKARGKCFSGWCPTSPRKQMTATIRKDDSWTTPPKSKEEWLKRVDVILRKTRGQTLADYPTELAHKLYSEGDTPQLAAFALVQYGKGKWGQPAAKALEEAKAGNTAQSITLPTNRIGTLVDTAGGLGVKITSRRKLSGGMEELTVAGPVEQVNHLLILYGAKSMKKAHDCSCHKKKDESPKEKTKSFQVGDRVTLKTSSTTVKAGEVGTVEEVATNRITVKFAPSSNGEQPRVVAGDPARFQKKAIRKALNTTSGTSGGYLTNKKTEEEEDVKKKKTTKAVEEDVELEEEPVEDVPTEDVPVEDDDILLEDTPAKAVPPLAQHMAHGHQHLQSLHDYYTQQMDGMEPEAAEHHAPLMDSLQKLMEQHESSFAERYPDHDMKAIAGVDEFQGDPNSTGEAEVVEEELETGGDEELEDDAELEEEAPVGEGTEEEVVDETPVEDGTEEGGGVVDESTEEILERYQKPKAAKKPVKKKATAVHKNLKTAEFLEALAKEPGLNPIHQAACGYHAMQLKGGAPMPTDIPSDGQPPATPPVEEMDMNPNGVETEAVVEDTPLQTKDDPIRPPTSGGTPPPPSSVAMEEEEEEGPEVPEELVKEWKTIKKQLTASLGVRCN